MQRNKPGIPFPEDAEEKIRGFFRNLKRYLESPTHQSFAESSSDFEDLKAAILTLSRSKEDKADEMETEIRFEESKMESFSLMMIIITLIINNVMRIGARV